jgi:leucine dehydrogenase
MEITRLNVPGYEEVYRAVDPKVGLRALIAVHDTTLGPALGGCRMWHFTREDDALTDVLRLAKGMTYKSAVARTGLGGGKCIIIGDPKTQKTAELFRSMGRFVHTLGGRYMTAEDVGTNEEDMQHMKETTPYVTGLPRKDRGSGDPSPFTALGVFLGIKACVEEALDRGDMKGLTVAIQGVGNVGFGVAKQLREAGARLIVADVNESKAKSVATQLGAEVVDTHDIHAAKCDVFSPNALGAVLNDRTIPQIKAKVVAGGANNQLAEDRHGAELLRRGILYAPDFLINAGGIINVSCEFLPKGYDEQVSLTKVRNIYDALKDVIKTSRAQSIPTSQAAVVLAEKILAEGRKSRRPTEM